MTLRLIREPSRDGATFGSLYVDGVWECWMLEDQIRERPGVPVEQWKVHSQTAIPEGRYEIIIAPSVRFKRDLPRLVKVSGFSGILMHPGNTIHDTEGCLLPGTGRTVNTVTGSKVAFERLFERLKATTDTIWIVIENPKKGENL